jgi:superfamily II DNA or RNA helicase
MPEPIQELFEALRAACSPSTWSRAVELVRAEAVHIERDAGNEIALRVATRGGVSSHRVILLPDEAEWECECAEREGACEHAAAAAIALRSARARGTPLPRAGHEAGRIGYRLTRATEGLRLERVVMTEAGEEPLATTIAALGSGRVDGPALVATRDDLALERALGTHLRGSLPRGLWPSVLAALSRCDDVRLDGEPIKTTDEPLGWVADLSDQGDGFCLRAGPDPRIRERFANDVVRSEQCLHPSGATRLTGRELEELTRGKHFDADQAARLVTEELPSLAARIPLAIHTQRLPRTTSEPPRIAIEVSREGEALVIFPTLVYGDPPIARIDAGRLVPLAGPVPLRDEARERALLRDLARDLALVPGRRVVFSDEDALAMAERLARWEGAIRGQALAQFTRTTALEPHFSASADDFSLRFEVRGDALPAARSVGAARVLEAWRSGASLIGLPGGGFAPLPAEWLARVGDRVVDLLAARAANGVLPRAALPDLIELCAALDAPLPDALEALRARVAKLHEVRDAPLPADLRATLRSYQRRGVDWLFGLREAGLGGLLADDMGLGKTLQALCALRGRTLVVAPTSVLHNWAAEITRFRPALRHALYHGPDRRLDASADVTLTSYAILRLDAQTLAEPHWDTIVLDEAQAIKNPESQVARAAFAMRGDFRLALTGTPVENRLEELWSQLHFANPGLLGTRRDFAERYAGPIAAGDRETAAHLRARIAPFLLRRLKREVAPELPPRTESVLHVVLDAEERRVYEAIRAATRREVLERLAAGGGVLKALEALLRLRQAACHSALVPGQHAPQSSKLTLLLENLEEALSEGHRALVFSQWTSLLDLVEPVLVRAGIGFTRLDGSTRDRAAVVEHFQSEGGPPVMLLSLKAGGVGLNLTAADCVFVLDPWWNPAVEDQAADRAHRIGQQRPVMVYRLVSEETVEERILALQARKRELAEIAVGAASGGAILSREELLDLLA